MTRTDVVVVGSGAGGAACAAALAQGGLQVLVLEEGKRYKPKEFPASQGWALNHIYADRGSRFVEAETLYPMPAGKGVGGSTLINSAICYRAPDRVLKKWSEQLGLERLAPASLAPIYDMVEEVIGVTEMHPLQARANNLFIKRGAEKLGMDGGFVHRNAPGCVGCGVCQLGCPSGGKGSVDRNFVPIAEEHGARIVPGHKAVEILMRKGRAVGVLAQDQDSGKTVRVEANAVVLAAGTVGTPMLLLSQKLANRSGQLGRNLSIHPAVGTFGFVEDAINSWDGVPQAYAVHLDRARGILLQAYNMPPEIIFASMPWSGLDGMRRLKQIKHLAMCGGLISDHASGQVRPSFRGKPKITYQLHDDDRRKLIEALRGVVKILFAAGATEVHPGVGAGLHWAKSQSEALSKLPDSVPEKSMHIYASHPMGTCRMGRDPNTSVVGPDGQSHDVPGLYVADASLMPTSLGVNPQVTVMSLGTLVGRQICEAMSRA